MRVKSGLAEMLKGGVIMDVVDAEQAKIAEDAGACAVMALERVPADIRRDGGVARMSDPDMIKEIQEAVTIPVMAKCRIGHFAEAQILQALEIDYIDESEVLTPADLEHHVDKWDFTVPFVCGCTNLGEALRRIAEGAAMIRTKGEAGTGRHRQRGHAHARGVRRHPPAAVAAQRGALRRGEEPAGAVRPRALGGRARPAAGRDVHRGRHRDARRRGALHAARRRRRVRRLGHLQVGRPRTSARGRSSRRPRTTSTRDVLAASRPVSARRWSASRPRRSTRASCSSAAAGSPASRHRRPRVSRLGARPARRRAGIGRRATWWERPPDGLPGTWRRLDVRDPAAVAEAAVGADAIVHTAYRQWRRRSGRRTSKGRRRSPAAAGRRLVHLSSDLVFDGARGRYRRGATDLHPSRLRPLEGRGRAARRRAASGRDDRRARR